MADTAIDTESNPYLQPVDWGTGAIPMTQPVDPRTGPIPMTQPIHIVQGQGLQHGADIAQAQPAPQPPPAAHRTPPPPPRGVAPPPAAPAFDEEEQFKLSLKNDADAFAKNKYSVLRGEPMVRPQLIDPAQDERIREIEELRKLVPKATPKEQRELITTRSAPQNRT